MADRIAPTDEVLRTLLTPPATVAVVGLSERPDRPSYAVASYLQRKGFRIVPINPAVAEVLGEKSYATLSELPLKVDIVDVFRRAEFVPGIVEEAIAHGARMLWLQEGVIHLEAAQFARSAGLEVVMNLCILKEHARLI